MGESLKALLTLDLAGVSDEQREKFYTKLEDKHWEKIDGMTTAWQKLLPEFSSIEASKAVKDNIGSAIKSSGVNSDFVKYAFQIGYGDVVIKN